jgi:hypothetical protein
MMGDGARWAVVGGALCSKVQLRGIPRVVWLVEKGKEPRRPTTGLRLLTQDVVMTC